MSVSLDPAPPPRGEDLPCDDGEPMESERHRDQMNVLVDSLRDHTRDREDVYVGGNMAVYFSETQARKNDFRAPDVFAVLDTHRGERRSWVVWEEGGRTPDVVIEITSPSTEDADRGVKMRVYARMLHVSTYVIYDPFTCQLDGFRLEGMQYVPIPLDEAGCLPVEPLALVLGVVPACGADGAPALPQLRWFDREGCLIPQRSEREAAGRVREAARADAEAARADAEAARADAEAARAHAEAARAHAETARADAETARADAAEAEAARLRRLVRG